MSRPARGRGRHRSRRRSSRDIGRCPRRSTRAARRRARSQPAAPAAHQERSNGAPERPRSSGRRSTVVSPAPSSITSRAAAPCRSRAPSPRGTTRTGRPGRRSSDRSSKWSGCPCEMTTMSASSSAGSGRGPWRCRGPSRDRRNGSVRTRTPPSSISVVAWPTNRTVIAAALAGSASGPPLDDGVTAPAPGRGAAVSDGEGA